jgi:serine/threonine-protein kinase HipA
MVDRTNTKVIQAMQLSLHGHSLGVLTHDASGKNKLIFDPTYRALPDSLRSTFTMTQLTDPHYLDRVLVNNQRIAPVLSNLLPEGALREWMARSLKVDTANEFPLLAWVGNNLPGALVASPIAKGEIPAWALSSTDNVSAVHIDLRNDAQQFSLAGVQMKFSTVKHDGRFNISADAGANSWIIKTPSMVHKYLPENEYTAMRLASAIGVEIPEIGLSSLTSVDNLPDIALPNETQAYVIRRFDRSAEGRIHTEDFAQIFELYAHDKYDKRNYEQIAAVLYRVGAGGLADIQQMARRLLANILLANGDAHLKNWTVIYPDKIHPRLAPAYDIVTTLPYISGEKNIALNMGKQKAWHDITMDTFQIWTKRINAPWPAIKMHLQEALDCAKDNWPQLLQTLPMHEAHKIILKKHWASLSKDFSIYTAET